MKDRIKQFIDYKGISAGELADLLDVQRSNISHILNGRNKPGAIFMERFLLTFPEVNARWLLTGKGEMINVNNNSLSTYESEMESDTEAPAIKQDKTGEIKETVKNQEKSVEKVILLHTDGSFSYYTIQ